MSSAVAFHQLRKRKVSIASATEVWSISLQCFCQIDDCMLSNVETGWHYLQLQRRYSNVYPAKIHNVMSKPFMHSSPNSRFVFLVETTDSRFRIKPSNSTAELVCPSTFIRLSLTVMSFSLMRISKLDRYQRLSWCCLFEFRRFLHF